MNKYIDINVDVGEGLGNESEIMPLISSCNIACGGHAGDAKTMKTMVALAKSNNVKIGAHPSFPDKENFGRKIMNMPCVALYTTIEHQIKCLLKELEDVHLQLHHVKPHGALYNLATIDEKTAKVIIEVMKGLMTRAKLYVPYNSVIAKLAVEHNIPVMYEAFADRNYNDDLTLVSRTVSNAVIEDADELYEHVFRVATSGRVRTISGHLERIEAETFCVHGDNPNAVYLISNLTKRLIEAGFQIC
ncbi:5-oxoprolinase subunit PxpA [Tamlana fucoidanivorans]|uniref:5-oxoprolinase subunit PxpA n=1 Tax=Allotamlana fucoidanivorans TaxID=2583814 RepID=A0A5C4SH51_9FLAO|nr:5-oxoprolinase subunit PxpA [Tamlana fucoidanivorans]TNJ42965.1 5-oxoprolinase subunit PxpA [Tamlana fucoidanivorans]